MIEITLLVLATALSYPLGMALGSAWLLPLLNAAPAYLVMVRRLRRGDRRGAVIAMLLWAATMALVGTVTFAWWPSATDGMVLGGSRYRDEMFSWIRTGAGSEGSPRLFLPQHLGHLALFVLISLATASAASIAMGAVLVNYMDYYVASLFRAGVPGVVVAAMGWQPWALCRVAAFATLGAVLAEPLLARIARYRYEGIRSARRYVWGAALGILADWALKAALAPHWGLALRRYLG